MHLCVSGPAAALADVPEIGKLLTSVVARADEVFAKSSIHLPSPALTDAGSLHIGMLHGVVVRRLLFLIEGEVIVAHELMCQRRRDVVRIRRDFCNVGVLFQPVYLLAIARLVHRRATGTLKPGI